MGFHEREKVNKKARTNDLVILHAAPIHTGYIGGLGASVPRLVDELERIPQVRSGLLITVRSGRFKSEFEFPVFHLTDISPRRSIEQLPEPFCSPDLVVFHDTYIPAHLRLAHWAHKRQVPYIIAPRGSLSPIAQGIKPLKKRVGNLFGFRRFLRRAAAIHCLTDVEAMHAKEWNHNTIVVGNGVDLPYLNRSDLIGQRKPIRFLYIGRLSRWIKGLDLLVDALALIKPLLDANEVRVDIYGPDEGGGRAWMNQEIIRHGLQEFVSISGPVTGAEKRQAFENGDVFLHTSRSEGHPMSVLEALAYGLPCILTPGTNIANVVSRAAAGWAVQEDSHSIACAIEAAIKNKGSLPEMGACARALCQERYQWSSVASETLQQYVSVTRQDS